MTAPIRRACAEDAGLLRAITREADAKWAPELGREPAPTRDDFSARVAHGKAWLPARDAPCVLEEKLDALAPDNLAVRPAAQGRSLGRQLIDLAQMQAQCRGHRVLRLHTSAKMAANIALYERLGFR